MLFFEENKDTYRTLSEENIKLQAEVMQYKVQRKKRPVQYYFVLISHEKTGNLVLKKINADS